MSKESVPELTKSWVFVDPTSGVQEVTENEPHDSDTDSISVISESGCSYKTDDEEFASTSFEEPEIPVGESEEPPDVPDLHPLESLDENKSIEKFFYFATSAVCAVIIIGFSVAVQQYLNNSSDVDNFEPDFAYQNVKTDAPKKYIPKRKSHLKLEELENKFAKLEVEKHDKIARDNDPRAEGNLKSIYKLNKNKCNKENCDAIENRHDETYDKKIKELKVKEDYLREKEKFLIEKEHDLLKKEIKLNREKENYDNTKKEENKHDKKRHYEDDDIKKYRPNKDCKKSTHKKQKVDEQHKKRNISGQWYINMHEGRDNMRQKKRSLFKKNKAHWYFQWMVDRARLRVK
ncbi:pre-mRNA-splicing factor CWC22 homolog [Tribolium madens]|uniref:pre-mRNA-splicing factor CWC22 homolog n=1 Tax=Tribolium madens TaxID=41895 RepID=UPI001CF72002|nr:pre-mRNA-splicing factor CWC22 homolog [Tribolium madens]XP_044256509.1 pre-mRNA-splicing factor CWC22 homolog [Tribolium madens]